MKRRTNLRKLAVICLTSLVLGVPGLSRAESGLSQIYIFGDSLSDPGNIYALTGETSKAPYVPIPEAAYAIGGHQFTNGKTWAQRLAQSLQLNKGGKSAMEAPGVNGNYAFAGARARADSGSLAPDFTTQLGMFLSHYSSFNSDALYVVQFGGNDIRDALVAGVTDPSGATSIGILESAAEKVAENIHILYSIGARNFLVVNAPNIGFTPVVRMMGAEGAASFFSAYYNMSIEGRLSGLDALPEVSIQRYNLAGFLNSIITDPSSFGITETLSPCLLFFTKSDAKCGNADEHLFWDGFHPTATVHSALGDLISRQVKGE
jgi:phospholipase/lecithinase/hemolysin